MKGEEKTNNRKWLIPALLFCMAICIGITIWAVFFRTSGDPVATPDYTSKDFDTTQDLISGDNNIKLGAHAGSGAINATLCTEANVSLSDKTVTLSYANPSASTQNVMLLIRVQDLLVAKSNLIAPGYMAMELKLEEKAAAMLSEGQYRAELVICVYDPDSNEKAAAEANYEITLNVTE